MIWSFLVIHIQVPGGFDSDSNLSTWDSNLLSSSCRVGCGNLSFHMCLVWLRAVPVFIFVQFFLPSVYEFGIRESSREVWLNSADFSDPWHLHHFPSRNPLPAHTKSQLGHHIQDYWKHRFGLPKIPLGLHTLLQDLDPLGNCYRGV